MKAESTPLILPLTPYDTRLETGATLELGGAVRFADQRVFRYGDAGASNITRGKMQLAAAPIANHANMTLAATGIGAVNVTATPGATAGGADIYSEGLFVINDVDGEGSVYKVKGHAAITSSVAFVINLFDPIVNVALTANSQGTLVHNAWHGVVEGTAATRRGAGVPLVSVLAGDFALFQTSGIAGVLIGAAATLGARLMADASTAGAVTDQTDVTAPQAEVQLASASIAAGVATEFNPVMLEIDKG